MLRQSHRKFAIRLLHHLCGGYPSTPCSSSGIDLFWISKGQASLTQELPSSLSCCKSWFSGLALSQCCFYSGSGDASVSQCWKCGTSNKSLLFLVCDSCGSIQPADKTVDYFQIFDLNKDYNVKTDNLDQKYKNWQKKLHPDLIHSKSEREKAYAVEQSGRVIDAYRTISNPLSRALYLLEINGLHVDEEMTISDVDLLQEIMGIREDVESASDQKALKQIQCKVQKQLESLFSSLKNAFTVQDFANVKALVQVIKYYERVMEEIAKKI